MQVLAAMEWGGICSHILQLWCIGTLCFLLSHRSIWSPSSAYCRFCTHTSVWYCSKILWVCHFALGLVVARVLKVAAGVWMGLLREGSATMLWMLRKGCFNRWVVAREYGVEIVSFSYGIWNNFYKVASLCSCLCAAHLRGQSHWNTWYHRCISETVWFHQRELRTGANSMPKWTHLHKIAKWRLMSKRFPHLGNSNKIH